MASMDAERVSTLAEMVSASLAYRHAEFQNPNVHQTFVLPHENVRAQYTISRWPRSVAGGSQQFCLRVSPVAGDGWLSHVLKTDLEQCLLVLHGRFTVMDQGNTAVRWVPVSRQAIRGELFTLESFTEFEEFRLKLVVKP